MTGATGAFCCWFTITGVPAVARGLVGYSGCPLIREGGWAILELGLAVDSEGCVTFAVTNLLTEE